MRIKSQSYSDRIRRIAGDLSKLKNAYDVDHTINQLRAIADELDRKLKKTPRNRN